MGRWERFAKGTRSRFVIDRRKMSATVDLVGENGETFGPDEGRKRLAAREPREDLRPHPALPDDTRLWAAMVQASGGIWGGCVYDVDAITERLRGKREAGSLSPKQDADILGGT